MAVLNIRNLPDEVRSRLRIRAAKAGRSMEAEARAILAAACAVDEGRQPASALQDWVDGLYGAKRPRKVVEALLRERRRESAKE
ncbi:MAG: Arc family DNA-binding protein [Deltaproteobacteria bacterium]|nr:Arc family DNA-binding protein [Deltaproteobacteria bacterium]